MPVLSGIELATQVQGHCPNCKVLLFSGQLSTIHLLEAARGNGRNFEVLQKPVHPTDLLKKIQLQLGIRLPLGTGAQLETGP
jgi:DNA-binding NtrC family response regulator